MTSALSHPAYIKAKLRPTYKATKAGLPEKMETSQPSWAAEELNRIPISSVMEKLAWLNICSENPYQVKTRQKV